jgi:thymidylate synthase (FAD)
MKIVEQSAELYRPVPSVDAYRSIEAAARVSHKSSGTPEQREVFLRRLWRIGHHSCFEHESMSVCLVTDRGVLAELTRHRLASFVVESTRYVDYRDPDSFKVIIPSEIRGCRKAMELWKDALRNVETVYGALIAEHGHRPEIARSVLPQAFATRIRMTANIREWRHIFQLRLSSKAHPQMRELMTMVLKLAVGAYPVLFEDLN